MSAARGIERAGFICGVAFIATSVMQNSEDLRWGAIFGLCAVALLAAAGRLGIRLLLRSRLPAEIERGNVAAGVAAGAHYASTGLIIARCLYGDDLDTLLISVVFFVVAQATLHVFVVLFRLLTLYEEDQEIAAENVAAAVSYAGVMMALALIIGHAAEGDFAGWLASFKAYGVALLSALVLYPVRQFIVQTLLLRQPFSLRGGRLDALVAQEHNVGASAVEAVSYLAAAFLLTGVW